MRRTAPAAAVTAAALARASEVGLLMKGDLHTEELMHAVAASQIGLRTTRRISHVYLTDVPDYPRPLLVTDAAINISPTFADKAGIVPPVAGRADILVVPDLKAGNLHAKQLTFLAGAEAAGLVLGASVPIILTSRADSANTRLASCALGVLMARAGQAARV
jgi:phosphotransacetylase